MARTVASWIRNLTLASIVAAASARADDPAKPPVSIEAKPNELDARVRALECRTGEDATRHQYDPVLWRAFGAVGVAFALAWLVKSVSDNNLARQKAEGEMIAAMWKSLVEKNDVTVEPVASVARVLLRKMRGTSDDANEKTKEGSG